VTGFFDRVQGWVKPEGDALHSGKDDRLAQTSSGLGVPFADDTSTQDTPADLPVEAPTQAPADAAVPVAPPQPDPALVEWSKPNPDLEPPKRSPRRFYQAWYAWVVMAALAGAGGFGMAAIDTVRQIQSELPDPEDALTYTRDGSMTIKAADGTVLQQLGPATREALSLDQIPETMINAFIAAEDKKFYEHNGVDYRAIARAALANLSAGEVVEGASTITQQVTRIVFLGQERTLDRKLREALMAHKMENELTKDQILERYLNLVYLGSGAYGVGDAAWIYFSKPIGELSLSEMAMIAGLAPAPSEYSPLVNPDLARSRRDIVLERMYESGFITAAELAEAKAAEIELTPSQPRNLISQTPHFTSYILQQELPQRVSPEVLEVGGLTIETTLNPKWQAIAQETVAKAVERYGRWERFSEAALVSIDPRTGEIKALVGGKDLVAGQFNRATQAQRQPGSTFKAFVYTAAIAAGLSPYKSYLDSKFVVDGYEVKNYSERHSGHMSMRDALARSINVIAVKVLLDAGFDPVMEISKRMGIQSKLIPAYSLALGTLEVNLLELTSAYGTLAAQGKHIEPHGITRIIDRYGNVIYEANFTPEQAVDTDSANIMTWMLRGVVNGGTGGNAALRGRPVAGKTGTTDAKRDLWFIGYIPQLVTGVWLGNDNNRPTAGASSTAALVWRNYMAQATEGMPVESFPQPNLRGDRKGSIKAERIRPRRMVVGPATGGDAEGESSGSGSRSRRRSEEAAPARSPSSPAAREASPDTRSEPRKIRNSDPVQAAPSSPAEPPPVRPQSPATPAEPEPRPAEPRPEPVRVERPQPEPVEARPAPPPPPPPPERPAPPPRLERPRSEPAAPAPAPAEAPPPATE
jgi:penicillin-binding protein 1A